MEWSDERPCRDLARQKNELVISFWDDDSHVSGNPGDVEFLGQLRFRARSAAAMLLADAMRSVQEGSECGLPQTTLVYTDVWTVWLYMNALILLEGSVEDAGQPLAGQAGQHMVPERARNLASFFLFGAVVKGSRSRRWQTLSCCRSR